MSAWSSSVLNLFETLNRRGRPRIGAASSVFPFCNPSGVHNCSCAKHHAFKHMMILDDARSISWPRQSDPGTTKLYDRRWYDPEKAASFFATY
jgi:hypothetical protein